jgi:hypothetical protein
MGKRLISAKKLERQIKEEFKDNPYAMGQMLRWIRKQPTVDAVEVVRCKDCKHYMAEEKERCEALRSTPYGLCLKHRCLPLAGYHEYRNEDDFCSYGERKDNE